MKQIRVQVEETTSGYDREKLQERLAKLVGGVAVIKVGAATETEMKEKSASKDAMHATKAAVEEGIVAGGGVALLRASKALEASSSKAIRRSARRSSSAPSKSRMRWIVEQRAKRDPSSWPRSGYEGGRRLQRRNDAYEKISSRRGSSIRRKSFAMRCRTPRRLRRSC